MYIEPVETRGSFSNTQIVGSAQEQSVKQSEKKRETGNGIVRASAELTSDVTYGKQGDKKAKSAQDIMDSAGNLDAVQKKNEMVVGANTTDSADVEKLREDGFSLHDTDIHTVVTETDKIQMQLAKAGKDTSYYSDDLSPEQIAQIAGNAALASQYETAIAQAQALEALGEGAVKYLIDNDLMPTIENLYQAQYNGGSAYVKQPQAEEFDSQMREQITKIIASAGRMPTESLMEDAKWLAANNLPVTAETINYLQQLKDLALPPENGEVIEAMQAAVAEGKTPSQAYLADGYSFSERAEEAVVSLEQVTDEELSYVLSQGQELTIETLKEAKNILSAQNGTSESGMSFSVDSLALLKAKRQLEEIRLAMTTEANYGLLKRGMEIETRPLEQLVEDLKAQEKAYYEGLFGVEKHPSEDQLALFQETLKTAEELQTMPAYAIGSSMYDGTIESLHAAGNHMQDDFTRAGEAYETMMTTPRSDLGDSIRKAFANVDELLKALDMEQTPANERAVRILSYNRTEVTEQSILEIKLADRQVQQAFDSLKPSVVREMIKEGLNPLKLNMEELNTQANRIAEKIGANDEVTKFSEYLWKLEQNHSISEKERDSYIGIYRLIQQVEAGDGAAIGALVGQGATLTMENLLMAVRSEKKGNMDYSIDDDFSGVDGAIVGKSITDQINAAYEMECFKEVQKLADEPEAFTDLLQSGDWQQMTPEQLMEKLMEYVPDDKRQQAFDEQLLEDLKAAATAQDACYEMLENADLQVSVNNVLAMQQFIYTPNETYKRLLKMFDTVEKTSESEELLSEIAKIKEEILQRIGEDIRTPEELAKAQQTLAEVAEHCSQTYMYEEGMTALDLRQLQISTKALQIGAKLAKNEQYQIPILTSDGVVGVNVKIVRTEQKKGTVQISMQVPAYGNVSAELKPKSDRVDGYIAADSRTAVDWLESKTEQINALIGNAVPIVFSAHTDPAAFAVRGRTQTAQVQEETYRAQTKELYQLAEKMITFFREGLA
ncbi:MAG: DUF6240 domain-containing protein [bacterium]|nr:DUF6240 domain-containing protein [bacterium]